MIDFSEKLEEANALSKASVEEVNSLTDQIAVLISRLNSAQGPSSVISPPAPEPPPSESEKDDQKSNITSESSQISSNKCQSSKNDSVTESTAVTDTNNKSDSSLVTRVNEKLDGHDVKDHNWCTKCQGNLDVSSETNGSDNSGSGGNKSVEVVRLRERLQQLETELSKWQDEVTVLQKKEALMKLQIDSAASTICNSPADSTHSSPQHVPHHSSIHTLIAEVSFFNLY